jgi:hypothetical protein
MNCTNDTNHMNEFEFAAWEQSGSVRTSTALLRRLVFFAQLPVE